MAQTGSDWQYGYGADGVAVVRFERGEREGRPWADRLEAVDPGADPAALVAFVQTELAGWVVSGPVRLGEELVRRGAAVLRHGHTMLRNLTDAPPPGGWAGWADTPLRNGLRAVPCDRGPEALVSASRAAFGPGHPDHRTDEGQDERVAVQRLAELLSGQVIGPVLPSSSLVVDGTDRVVAGAVLTDRDGLPWIAHVFRDPAHGYPGLGRDLLRRVVAAVAAAGGEEIGLAVTEGNRARQLYTDLGFTTTDTSLTVIVP
ncbi:Acetyltransferase (GNAT) family protein [Streptomyces sp. TLI_053]|uniref:GNAT family N-acetyltransferase n=1 Tax=Streptomyces sp. TLI_053 TaxID=1855352 RepID=UPI00087B5CB8|nr:GNAT family N-acetyltransferase [Streptomyces sp. TLI_053]SDT79297.1 Acetyltransferase (GNAT) family protein [Streptomyces sp. TLI_053]